MGSRHCGRWRYCNDAVDMVRSDVKGVKDILAMDTYSSNRRLDELALSSVQGHRRMLELPAVGVLESFASRHHRCSTDIMVSVD